MKMGKSSSLLLQGTPASTPVAEAKLDPTRRFLQLWPKIQADLAGVQDVFSQLSPTEVVKERLSKAMKTPAGFPLGKTIQAILNRLPSAIEHMIVVPRLSLVAGSEVVTSRLIATLQQHYPNGGLCVIGPDEGFKRDANVVPAEVPLVAFNDIDASMDMPSRITALDRIMIEIRPRVVHSMNSVIAWMCFSKYARFYARDSKLYGNIYSDIRTADGAPAAYFFWKSLPETIDYMTGIMADNAAIIRRAKDCFGLLAHQMARLHVTPTPVLGMSGNDPARDLQPYSLGRPKKTLWLSRIAPEKRLDVLQAIAPRCPERVFTIYGAQFGRPVDLSALAALPNVEIRGAFNDISDVPAGEFDSYLFTTSAEGMPCTILEIAARGLPVIAPDIGGIGEFVDNETGWLISGPDAIDEYVNALREIEREPAKAVSRSKNAQRRLLERHTWECYKRAISNVPGYLA
jgi:glycosyltransferase involved in cell wall biosynthesis